MTLVDSDASDHELFADKHVVSVSPSIGQDQHWLNVSVHLSAFHCWTLDN